MRQPGPLKLHRRLQLVVAAEQHSAAVQDRPTFSLEPAKLPEPVTDTVEPTAYVGPPEQHRPIESAQHTRRT
jgi:hypothetical protein